MVWHALRALLAAQLLAAASAQSGMGSCLFDLNFEDAILESSRGESHWSGLLPWPGHRREGLRRGSDKRTA